MVVVWERFYGVEIKWWCYGSVFEVWRLGDGVMVVFLACGD